MNIIVLADYEVSGTSLLWTVEYTFSGVCTSFLYNVLASIPPDQPARESRDMTCQLDYHILDTLLTVPQYCSP